MGLISTIVGGIIDANRAIKQNQAQKDDTMQTVAVENRYSIDIPSFLSPTDKLGPDAAIQYFSRALDVSFQVTDEPKSEFIQSYEEMKSEQPGFGDDNSLLDAMAALTLTNLFDDIDKVEIGNREETVINGLNALTLNAFQGRTFFKDALYGSFAFIEGKDTLYQVVILSGGTSINKLADKLERSIKSFKEL